MIYLKKMSRTFDKYIKNKNERKYKNLETNILKTLFQVTFKQILKVTKKLLKIIYRITK